MTTRRQFVQGTIGATLLATLGAQRAGADHIELLMFLYGFPAGSSGDMGARRVAARVAGSP